MSARRYYIPDPPTPVMERLRKAYADREITMAAICSRFRMSDDRVARIAASQGWPLRLPRPVIKSRQKAAEGAQA